MPFDWKEYLDLAERLHNEAERAVDSEAVLRTAISRAYYGAFCYARNYARDWLDFDPRYDADDHGRVREHLKRKRRRAISDKLHRLRDWRNECDYQDVRSFDPQTVMGPVLTEANYVFESLIPPAPPTAR